MSWGYGLTTTNISLPITYTTKYQVTCTHWDSGDGTKTTSFYSPQSNLGQVHFGSNMGVNPVGVMFIVIGY